MLEWAERHRHPKNVVQWRRGEQRRGRHPGRLRVSDTKLVPSSAPMFGRDYGEPQLHHAVAP